MESHPFNKLVNDAILQLDSADDNIIIWLRDMAMKAFVKYIGLMMILMEMNDDGCRQQQSKSHYLWSTAQQMLVNSSYK